jgi:phosphoenolpyruvate synthase/pyruvate phosphate dikinase
LIASRQAAYQTWLALDPPAVLGLPDAVLPVRPPYQDDTVSTPTQAGNRIIGLGASPGRVSGRARLVRDLSSLLELQPGEILVAENAGPQWTPFFPALGGLVLDSGSLGQHAAATAREYGIPAVIAAGDATRRIPDGAWITIDGTAGTVDTAG